MVTAGEALRPRGATRGCGMLECRTKCGSPEAYGPRGVDASGVCNICRQRDFREESIDWAASKTMLDDLIEEHRGKHDYDCIVPFSGGKDSTFTLWYLVKTYGIKPL